MNPTIEAPAALSLPTLPLDATAIAALIPHRYPFILVDRVTELALEPQQRIVGYKNLSSNEAVFQGHFPERPIFPGVLQLEAMAQLAGILMGFNPKYADKLGVFAAMEGVRFRKVLQPGDRFDMEVVLQRLKGPVAKFQAIGRVEGQVAVEAELTFSFI